MLQTSTTTPRRTRGRPRTEEVPAIEGVLLDAALEEFLTNGYGGASLARIVRNAGVSKTTLWSRYAGKEALFRAIMQRQIDRMEGSAQLTPAGPNADLAQGLLTYGIRMLAASSEREFTAVDRLIATEAARFPELGVAAIRRTLLGVRQVAEFIRDCTREDEKPCRDPEGVASTFIAALRGWNSSAAIARRDPSRKQREVFVRRLVELLLAARNAW